MIPSCSSCGGKLLVYVTRKLANHTVRYRRCSHCRTTDKTVQMTTFQNPVESSTNPSALVKQSLLKSTLDEQFDEPNGDKKWLR